MDPMATEKKEDVTPLCVWCCSFVEQREEVAFWCPSVASTSVGCEAVIFRAACTTIFSLRIVDGGFPNCGGSTTRPPPSKWSLHLASSKFAAICPEREDEDAPGRSEDDPDKEEEEDGGDIDALLSG